MFILGNVIWEILMGKYDNIVWEIAKFVKNLDNLIIYETTWKYAL